MTIDPDTVPATPVYTITVNANGAAAVNGQEVTGSGLDPEEARVLALGEVRVKAALHGRPVRVLAKDADGTAWPLIVATDGSVTTLDRPHPVPPPPEPEPVPPPPPTGWQPHQGYDEFTVAIRRDQAPPWMVHGQPRTDGQMPAAAPAPDEWAALLPAEYRPLWGQLTAHVSAATYPEAIITADHLERALGQQYGPLHPHTVNVLTVRAWLTLVSAAYTQEWAETAELLVETAQRRQEAKAPEDETHRTIRNAHGAWLLLTRQDPESARELAEPLLTLLVSLPMEVEHARRAQSVVRWIESGAA
ncbi:hypothetical protein OG762_51760 (plasmid) [Streptomyces sp. NBC_01136]|uniref:hypothetical protein n=1 Tax=Streptomyces sp. NBC_01136 TaxID=2903754 RepID=UPI002F913647|nr:hypothetical protein OG762_51760 [Streptomyces sp. NBC_01136]